MDPRILRFTVSHRDQWLALLDKYGVSRPKFLHVIEVPGPWSR